MAQGLKAAVFRLEREQEDMANNRLKLTQTNVQRLIRAHDGATKVRHWDTEVPKLFPAITPNGCAAHKLQIVKPDGSKTNAKLCRYVQFSETPSLISPLGKEGGFNEQRSARDWA